MLLSTLEGVASASACLKMRTTIMSRILKVLFFFYLSLKMTMSQTRPSVGLYFMLGNDKILPAETVNMYDIGSQPANLSNPGSTLVCVTTNVNRECCRMTDRNDGRTIGDWFFMNNRIPRFSNADTANTFQTIHWQQQVRLSRNTDQIGTSGFYKCVIPDGNGSNFSASIHIMPQLTTVVSSIVLVTATTPTPAPTKVTITSSTSTTSEPQLPRPEVTITSSDTFAIVGSEFSLTCSSDLLGEFHWRRSDGTTFESINVTNNEGFYSILHIYSVQPSHAGTYICQIDANGVTQSKKFQVIIQNTSTTSEPQLPLPEVTITSSNTFAVVESVFSLNCSSDLFSEFHWRRSDDTTLESINVTNNEGFYSILQISSVRPSHAGTYICQVDANGVIQSNKFQVIIQNSNTSSSKVTQVMQPVQSNTGAVVAAVLVSVIAAVIIVALIFITITILVRRQRKSSAYVVEENHNSTNEIHEYINQIQVAAESSHNTDNIDMKNCPAYGRVIITNTDEQESVQGDYESIQ